MLIEEVEHHYETVQISAATPQAVADLHSEFDEPERYRWTCSRRIRDVQAEALTWAHNARNENEVRTSTEDGSSVKVTPRTFGVDDGT